MKAGFVICIFALGIGLPAEAIAGSVWVWANNAKAASYTPNAKFTESPEEGKVQIKRTSPGRYEITMTGWKNAPPRASNVQVTAYGAGSNHCKVASWSPSGDLLNIRVHCFTVGGTPDDSMFSALISYREDDSSSRNTAFAWSSSARASHTAKAQYAKNGRRPVQVNRLKTGSYETIFTDRLAKTHNGGNVQVTAYGKSNTQCKIQSWTKRRTDLVVKVLCFQPTGAPIDSLFSILVHGR